MVRVKKNSQNKLMTKGDKVFDAINIIFLTIALLLAFYPIYFIVISSFSDFVHVLNGEVWFWPKGICLDGYEHIFNNSKIWIGYRNTICYTVVGTTINVILTLLCGYALSRKDFYGRNILMYLITFTMIFNGGLIPTYLVIKDLNLIDNFWVMILPNAVAAYNIIITKTFFQNTIPDQLLESAYLDGCSNTRFFFRIALPLSKALIAVIVMFYAVGHWNTFFNAFIYLKSSDKMPLQIVLRDIVLEGETMDMMSSEMASSMEFTETDRMFISEQIKNGVIVAASLPMLILYPFLQKYFIQGVMVGAIKG